MFLTQLKQVSHQHGTKCLFFFFFFFLQESVVASVGVLVVPSACQRCHDVIVLRLQSIQSHGIYCMTCAKNCQYAATGVEMNGNADGYLYPCKTGSCH